MWCDLGVSNFERDLSIYWYTWKLYTKRVLVQLETYDILYIISIYIHIWLMKINIFLYILCGLSECVIDVHQHGEILKFYAGRGKSTEPLPPPIGTKNIRDHHVGSKMPSQISIVTSCGFQYHSWLIFEERTDFFSSGWMTMCFNWNDLLWQHSLCCQASQGQ